MKNKHVNKILKSQHLKTSHCKISQLCCIGLVFRQDMILDLVISFGKSCTWRNVAHSKNSSETTQLAKPGMSPFVSSK